MLIGRPDLFIIKNSKSFLEEFKSSSLRNIDGLIRTEYLEQVLFYSILLFDNYNIKHVESKIKSLNGDSIIRIITRDEAREMKLRIYSKIHTVNNSILSASDINNLATPSQAACSSCQKKIICKKFQESQLSIGLKNNSYVIEGEIISIIKDNKGASCRVYVKSILTGKTNCIKLPSNEVSNLLLHCKYIFDNLTLENELFVWSNKSRLFK